MLLSHNLSLFYAGSNLSPESQHDYGQLDKFHNSKILWKYGHPHSRKFSSEWRRKATTRIPWQVKFLLSPFIPYLTLLWMTLLQPIFPSNDGIFVATNWFLLDQWLCSFTHFQYRLFWLLFLCMHVYLMCYFSIFKLHMSRRIELFYFASERYFKLTMWCFRS